MKLSARDRRRIQRAVRARSEGDGGLAGELNIIPFLDITVNLMLFLLAASAVTLTTVEVHARLPDLSPRPGVGTAPTHLNATLTSGGVILGTAAGFVRPGCEAAGPGAAVAIPAADGHAVDTQALQLCAVSLHTALPGVEEVILTADPAIPYEELIRAMDALRASGETPLFPRVLISGGVR